MVKNQPTTFEITCPYCQKKGGVSVVIEIGKISDPNLGYFLKKAFAKWLMEHKCKYKKYDLFKTEEYKRGLADGDPFEKLKGK